MSVGGVLALINIKKWARVARVLRSRFSHSNSTIALVHAWQARSARARVHRTGFSVGGHGDENVVLVLAQEHRRFSFRS